MILTETSNANAILFLSPLLEKNKKPLQQLVGRKKTANGRKPPKVPVLSLEMSLVLQNLHYSHEMICPFTSVKKESHCWKQTHES